MNDVFLYSDEHLIKQMATAQKKLGYLLVQFYVDQAGILAKEKTDRIDTFYLSPSGGTLRDSTMNIVHYSAKFDMYKGLGKAEKLG